MAALSWRDRRAVPAEHRANFLHLYLDIAWFGVLNGSSIAFVAIYATRLGAGGLQIGLLNAAPALTALVFALPAGQWMVGRRLSRVVFWTAVWHRLWLLPWVFLPLWLTPGAQVWALIGLMFLMSVPGTFLSIGFNGMFAAAVPEEWRGKVVGTRNALFAVMSIAVSLVCGWVLGRYSAETGYQIVFAIGFLGAVVSTFHLWFVRPLMETAGAPAPRGNGLNDWAQPGEPRPWVGLRLAVGLRYFLAERRWRRLVPLDIFAGRYKIVLLLLLGFHLSQYLAIPLFPLFVVNRLNLSDQTFSLGNGLFYGALFIGSLALATVSQRLGHQRTLALGAVAMSLYPLLIGLSQGAALYLVTSIVGGLAWALAGGALSNYLLEQVPAHNRPPYLAWYNLALHAAVLIGSLVGPLLADWLGLVTALFIAAGLRLTAGALLWRFG